MDTRVKKRRFLIVTKNVVVAEDLKDILKEIPECRIDTCLSLGDGWDDDYGLAFFDVPVETLMKDKRVRKMHRSGANVVVMDGGLSDSSADCGRLSVLAQPFRSTDVVSLLHRLGFATESRP